jgi:hypothetical protein
VSGNYIASEFITTQELPRLFEAARTRGLQIFWVLISPCLYRTYPELQATQAFHDPSRPLVGMPEVQVEDVLSRLAEAAGEAARDRPEADEAEPERPVVELAPEPLLDSHPCVLLSPCTEPEYRGGAVAAVYRTIVPMAFEDLPISEVVSPPEEDWGLSDTLPRASQLPKIVVTFAGVAKLLDWARDLWKALVGAILDNDTVRNFLLVLLLLFSGFLPPMLVARARKGKIAGQHLLGLFLGLGALGLIATAAGVVLGLKEGSPSPAAAGAETTLARIRAEHPLLSQQLESAWTKLRTAGSREITGLELATSEGIAPEVRRQFTGRFGEFAQARAVLEDELGRQGRMALYLVMLVVGLENLVCAAFLVDVLDRRGFG